MPDGVEVAVLLMDTQGLFDTSSITRDWTTVFALSTLISSVQIYNISQLIHENDLRDLQFFTEYGKLAMNEFIGKPFQNVTFLVRDWQYPGENSYGLHDGMQYLKKTLQVTDDRHQELNEVRQHIRDCFTDVNCFLLPHPGKIVASDKKFNGRIADIDPDFKEYMKLFVPRLVSRENLILKTISGESITSGVLFKYFQTYFDAFQSEDMPSPKSLLQAHSEVYNGLEAMAKAKEEYKEMMELFRENGYYLHSMSIECKHKSLLKDALRHFDNVCKIRSPRLRQMLMEQLEELKQTVLRENEIKQREYDLKKREEERRNEEAIRRQNEQKNAAKLVCLFVLIYICSKLLTECSRERNEENGIVWGTVAQVGVAAVLSAGYLIFRR